MFIFRGHSYLGPIRFTDIALRRVPPSAGGATAVTPGHVLARGPRRP
jgi:hypothetical protein